MITGVTPRGYTGMRSTDGTRRGYKSGLGCPVGSPEAVKSRAWSGGVPAPEKASVKRVIIATVSWRFSGRIEKIQNFFRQ